jgi:TPR repeat protein
VVSQGSGFAVPLQRVVAVVLNLANGREQTGTGYLVDGREVLTALHCTRDRATGAPPRSIRVKGATGGEIKVSPDDVTASEKLDLAVIRLPQDAPWDADSEAISYARIHRDRAGVVADCTAIGYPLYQYDPVKHTRHHAELHGTIYQTDEAESGRLLMREHFTPGSTPPDDLAPTGDTGGRSGWGGLSGALVFHADRAIGVVLEHHPRQGASAVQLCGFDQLIRKAKTDDATRRVAALLGLSPFAELPFTTATPVQPLIELVGILPGGDLPTVADLDPYRLGATKSAFGTSQTYGEHDPYISRTFNDVDTELAAALRQPGMVLVVGPSKAGKTRTCCEALRSGWPDARLLTPLPGKFEQLVAHPRLQTSTDTIVVWLDELERYLTHTHPLTPNLRTRLTTRPGTTIMVATLRTEARARLVTETGDILRDTRDLLDQAETIELLPTSEDPDEQAAAARAYPGQDLRFGLAAVLAGAPELLESYDAAKTSDPLQHAVIAVVIDWARVGRPDPIPEPLLKKLAIDRLWDTRPDLETTDQAAETAVRVARTPPESTGRVAALATYPLPDKIRGYRPFDYLVAADDGQRPPPRPIPDDFWSTALDDTDAETAFAIGLAAYSRNATQPAIDAFHRAADSGHTVAMINLGSLLTYEVDPPDLDAARHWFEQAAATGHTSAMYNLGILLAYEVDPPNLDAARHWWEQAAAAGDALAMNQLGLILEDRTDSPPDLDGARHWFEQAAAAGDTLAMFNLGLLLENQTDPPDLDAARHWYEQAAAAGHPGAMNNLGRWLLANLDPPDLDGARHWFEQAAAAGDTRAMYNLGWLLANLDPPDLDGARHWFEQAAAAGHPDAMVNLGVLLAKHLDPPDLDAARHWYEQLVAAGDPHAQTILDLIQRHVR